MTPTPPLGQDDRPPAESIIPGAMSRAEQEANVAAMREPLPAALWDDMRAEGLIRADAPVPAQ